MTVTTGYMQQLTCSSGPLTCAWVGPDPATTELLFISSSSNESDEERVNKQRMTGVLAHAAAAGRLVEITHPDDSAAVTAVSLAAGDVGSHPLQMDGIEVTQGMQDMGHSVPLFAGKRTVVRVYLSYYGASAISVSGELSVRTAANAAPVPVASAAAVTLNPANAGDMVATRNDAARSLNFVLPSNTTVAGQLSVRLSSVTNTADGTSVAFGNEVRPIVGFQSTVPLRVRIIRITYQQGTPPVTHAPTNLDYDLLVSWLRRVYPVGEVIVSQATVAATAAAPFGCGDVNTQIAAIRVQDTNNGTDARTHYYGLVSDSGFWMRGCASGVPAGNPDPTVVASGPTGPGNWGWDFDGSYGDWYGGHELGHTYGRLHPGFCGESANDLNNFPFPNGQLSTTDAGFAGFDTGDPANGLQMAALPGTQWTDVMTYCARQWMSVYTYLGLRQRLIAEDAAFEGAGAGPAPSPGPNPGGGRPDERYPDQVSRRAAAASPGATPTEPTPVSVIAQANLSRRRGKISFVNPVPNLAPTEAAGPALLRIKTADGQTLSEHPVPVKLNSELAPDADQVGIIDAVVVAAPGAAAIELVLDGDVVDAFQAVNRLPSVRGVRVVSAGTDKVGIATDLGEPGEEGHRFNVQISTDEGQTWQTVGVGLEEPSVMVERGQFSPGQEILARVVATNGFTSSVVTSEVFRA